MLELRPSNERGYADHGWLKSFHSFSFAGYHDPRHMGWGNLRVINEDRIEAGMGFGTHGHRDMEIISYVLFGALAHKDSMGNVESIPPGDVQRMSAGSGVTHSEFNHSQMGQTHFFQIWIEPNATGVKPGYAQRAFAPVDKRGKLCLLVSPDGVEGSLSMRADARLYGALLDGAESATLSLATGRLGYVHVVRGAVRVNGVELGAGDAAKLADEARIALTHARDAEVLVFDLAP